MKTNLNSYVQKDWKLIPLHGLTKMGCTCRKRNCHSRGKHPRIAGWQQLATNSITEVATWFTKQPKSNVGIVTGAASGIVVVDLDVKEGSNINGIESWSRLIETYGSVNTPEVNTGGGGRHLYFEYPHEGNIGNGVDVLGKQGFPGIDIRSDGGFVVAPPSLHASGQHYRWVEGHGFGEVELAPLPEWLLKLINDKGSRMPLPTAATPISKEVGAIQEGSRNSQMASFAGRLRRAGKSEESILGALLKENTLRCNPPLDEEEVARIAHSISQYEPMDAHHQDHNELLVGTGFSIKNNCFYKSVKIRGGFDDDLLSYFYAYPKQARLLDDGTTSTFSYEIHGKAQSGKDFPPIYIKPEELVSMNWPLQKWGTDANIRAGSQKKDSIREAMQHLSRGIPTTTVYTHTGWRFIDGEWAYLHAGGAIGKENITVELDPTALERYSLTTEGNTDFLPMVGKKFLEVASPEISNTLFATICLAAARELFQSAKVPLNFVPFLVGKTASGKSTLAALMLSFFGDFSTVEFPANFRDTTSNIEKKMFTLKDSVLVIDDFYPGQTRGEREVLNKTAQHIARLVGDGASRGRMRQDMSHQRSYPARSMVICTGEERPGIGESGHLRYWFMDIQRTDFRYDDIFPELKKNQATMRLWLIQYLHWLSDNWDLIRKDIPHKQREIENMLQQQGLISGRTLKNAATLIHGTLLGLGFMQAKDWLTDEEFHQHQITAHTSILELAKKNHSEAQSEKPVELFISTLLELLNTQKVDIERRQRSNIEGLYPVHSQTIGIFDEEEKIIYLLPQATFAAVQQSLHQQGQIFPLNQNTLWKHFKEAGLLAKTDEKENRLLVQTRLFGRKSRVLALKSSVLSPEPPIRGNPCRLDDNDDIF